MINHDTMKESIVDAARDVFAKYGYRKTTMDDIAMAVYKAKSSIYHYFSGKEEIFKAVIEKEADSIFREASVAIERENDPIKKFITLFTVFQQKVAETANYYQFLKDDWFEVFDFTRYAKDKNDFIYRGMITSILQQGNSAGLFAVEHPEEKAKAISVAFWGFIEPWNKWMHDSTGASLNAFLDILLYGIMKR